MKKVILLLIVILSALPVLCHTIDYQLDSMGTGEVFSKYLALGFKHIIPLGFDHILFITCLFFLNSSIKTVVAQASMFTVAHTITLGLAMNGIIKPPPAIVEPLIALSIVALACENLFSQKLRPARFAMVFLFGMIHGMGFAGALSALGMPAYAFAPALISFNAGVELGQLTIILVLFVAVSRSFSARPWYRKAVVIPVNSIIALFAIYLTIERVFFTS